nr:hypothetical protein [Deinococcus sp. Arct2-2]
MRGILAAPSITGAARKELERHGLEFAELTALPPPERGNMQPSLF